MRQFYVYIAASRSRVLYVGVTNNLERRMWEHRNGFGTFTGKYRVNRLVHFEVFEHPMTAIKREKRLKKFYRAEKIALIESGNPLWNDLAKDWF
jgi:putative endonuclease